MNAHSDTDQLILLYLLWNGSNIHRIYFLSTSDSVFPVSLRCNANLHSMPRPLVSLNKRRHKPAKYKKLTDTFVSLLTYIDFGYILFHSVPDIPDKGFSKDFQL